MQDHYQVLGVDEKASPDEIKAAWRRANTKAHPDRDGGSHEAQARVNEAYRVLMDAEERAAYDSGLEGLIADPQAARAREMLVMTFLSVVMGAPEGVDLVEDTHRMLNEHRAQHQAMLTEHRDILRKLIKRGDMMKFKAEGTDYLRAALEQRMSQVREVIEVQTEHVERIDRAHQMLSDYGCDLPPMDSSGGFRLRRTAGFDLESPSIPASRLAFRWPEGS